MTDMVRLRRDMVRIGLEVGAILNTVADDDERDELHGILEKTVNEELFAGATARSAHDWQGMFSRSVCGVDAEVIELSSRRVRLTVVRGGHEDVRQLVGEALIREADRRSTS